MLNHAHDIGATTIVIGDHIGDVLRPRPKILLAASRGGRGEPQSLTVPIAICNTLILEISQNDNRKTLKSLETLASLKQAFAKS